jgi:hypothetical protein
MAAKKALVLGADGLPEQVQSGDTLVGAGPGLPASSTDNALVRWDSTGGNSLQNSSATVSDNGCLTIAGGTITADEPALNISQTWNNAAVAFTGIKYNITDTACSASSKMLDIKLANSSMVSLNRLGQLNITRHIYFDSAGTLSNNNTQNFHFTLAGNGISISAQNNYTAIIYSGASAMYYMNGPELITAKTGAFAWASNVYTYPWWNNIGLELYADDDNILAQRHGTAAQKTNMYNTWTSATNYERFCIDWKSTANLCKLKVEAQTGTVRDLSIQDKLYFHNVSKNLTESTDTGILEISVTTGQQVSGRVELHIEAGDGTDFQTLKGNVEFVANNKAATVTSAFVNNETVNLCTSGTLTNVTTIANGTGKITINLNVTSSLAQTFLRCYYNAYDLITGTITPL